MKYIEIYIYVLTFSFQTKYFQIVTTGKVVDPDYKNSQRNWTYPAQLAYDPLKC